MAHRIIGQVVLTGTRVLSRAFLEAYKQASATSAYQKAQLASGNTTTSSSSSYGSITLDEACKILDVKPPQKGEINMENVMERFKKLYDVNDPAKGGSFYLQSKVLRARERIEGEVRRFEADRAREEEAKEGWKPKVFKEEVKEKPPL